MDLGTMRSAIYLTYTVDIYGSAYLWSRSQTSPSTKMGNGESTRGDREVWQSGEGSLGTSQVFRWVGPCRLGVYVKTRVQCCSVYFFERG